MDYKILFPTGYQFESINNGNIDTHIILISGDVFFGTLFTLKNIETLMSRNDESFFWATDMLIVNNLKIDTILNSVSNIIADKALGRIFSKIGTIHDVYNIYSFEEIKTIY